ncbi:MAG: hypothetical protein IJF73_03875 [Clostridia bacterium]|nr:hypothetical protein [Clostridia bacterium]
MSDFFDKLTRGYTPPGADKKPPREESPDAEPKAAPSEEPKTEAPQAAPKQEKKERPFLPAENRNLPIAALVLGIVSVMGSCFIGIPAGIAGIVVAIIDRVRRGYFEPMTKTGLGLAAIGIVLTVVTLIVSFGLELLSAELQSMLFPYL